MQPFQGCPYSAATGTQGSRFCGNPGLKDSIPLGLEGRMVHRTPRFRPDCSTEHSPSPRRLLFIALPIPTGLERPTQGCESSSYPGMHRAPCHVNPERVVSVVHARASDMIFGLGFRAAGSPGFPNGGFVRNEFCLVESRHGFLNT
jgi:hypothetical protein